MTRQIIIKFQIEGIHRWIDCNLPDVSFLKDYHRHIFFIEVRKNVNHNDRDIEIIMFKRNLLNYFGLQPVNFENKSCEDIAQELLEYFNLDYVKVLEDNENGALLKK